jgi:hypothetical protein
MTTPGYSVNPGDLHRHASQRRIQAADFLTDKPPSVPGDPDDPTVGATADLSSDVHGVNQHLHDKSHRTADKVDADGNAYSAQDQSSGGQVGGVGGHQGLGDAVKLGDVTTPLGTVASGALQGFTGMFAGLSQGLAQLAGQGVNVFGQLGAAQTKAAALPFVGADAGAGGGASASGGGGEDKKGETKPASATSPLVPQNGGAPRGLQPGDYAHTETQDREQHTVMPAGMGMGGMPAMGAGGSPSSSTKPRMYKVHTEGVDPVDPPTEPIPVVTEAAYAPSPLKEHYGADT